MQYIVHEVNSKEKLQKVSHDLGIEVDIRFRNNKLVMGHDPTDSQDDLEDMLEIYQHSLFVANIKDSGIESLVIETLLKHNIDKFFLLDMEFPYLVKNLNKYGDYLSTRFSEYENISTSLSLVSKVKWVWIDTFSKLPIDDTNISILKNFSSCLVSPSRWGRFDDIEIYIDQLKKLDYFPDYVMVEEHENKHWENLLS